MKLSLALAIALLSLRCAIAEEVSSLTVIDEANKSHILTAADVSKLPRVKLKVKVHEADAEFEGCLLSDALKSCGIKFGDDLKGRRAATVAILDATDNYRTVIPLLEIDSKTTDKQVVIADHRDGKPLDPKEGPFRLVIPDDKRPIRWIRMLRTIRVINLNDVPLGQSNHSSK